MQPRDQRDLPEVVAEILIEQHAMREEIVALRQDMQQSNRELREEIGGLRGEIGGLRGEIGGLRQEMQQSSRELREEIQQSSRDSRENINIVREEMVAVFNNMTNAILDAINRGTDRYNGAANEIDALKVRVTKLENPAA